MAEFPCHGLDLRLQNVDLIKGDPQGLLLDFPMTMMTIEAFPDLLVVSVHHAIPLLQVLHQGLKLVDHGLKDVLETICAFCFLGHLLLEVVEVCFHPIDL